MRRIAYALAGLVSAALLGASPAAAQTYEIDPLTREPIYPYARASGSPYPSASGYSYPGAVSDPYGTFRPQASAIPRQIVPFSSRYAAGTVVISTEERRLYYVLGGGQAISYGVGVGRPGFEWAGTRSVTMKREWPDWRPPAQMLRRRPDLPRYMPGGPGNPLGARAMYLGGTVYRIHGTNQPSSIGKRVSSGCIRMVNEDVVDLYSRVNLGTKVVVLPMTRAPANVAQAKPAMSAQPAMQVTSSYGPASAPQAAWDGIRVRGVY